ncbi:hypothetical protein PCASD_00065 [Puccinia coronata f. sp. avenae]|uniref:Uncharacterized protein n=1 Tax=Puccinia coronata f. sp. avenae TaxID=200324 RepID=A0A2N5VR09_9BASI|nr:hypothetical protein PCASD_00065 [Puccinia coronata f. sp. avenae]
MADEGSSAPLLRTSSTASCPGKRTWDSLPFPTHISHTSGPALWPAEAQKFPGPA